MFAKRDSSHLFRLAQFRTCHVVVCSVGRYPDTAGRGQAAKGMKNRGSLNVISETKKGQDILSQEMGVGRSLRSLQPPVTADGGEPAHLVSQRGDAT